MVSRMNTRTVAPELPDSSDWLPYLRPAIEQNWYTNYGPVNTRFEARLEQLYAASDEAVVSATNATAALSACLIAEAISGQVICPAFTFQATAAAILGANCSPFIVDVDPVTGVVAPEMLEAAFKKSNARAAIVLAPYGITTDFHEHEKICSELGKLLIIDNAAGLGVTRAGKSFNGEGGVVREVYSLHATKPFGIGEGAAIFAPTSKAASLRAAMNFGIQTHTGSGALCPPYWGINGKMSEFHAAIGLAVADRMADRVVARQEMALRWIENLQDSPVTIFHTAVENTPWQVFPIILPSEGHVLKCVEAANNRGIELRRYYAPSLGACRGMPSLGACPNAQRLAERVLVLPIRSYMPKDAQMALISEIKKCL